MTDTAKERAAAVQTGLPPGVVLPIPDGTVDAQDRAQLAGTYLPESAGGSDTTPDAFSFTDQSGVPTSSTVTSAAITITGIDTDTPISITNGEYSIDVGAWTSSPGTVTNGQQVSVRHTSSASYETAVNTTLDVGGVTDIFTSTTEAEPPAGSGGASIFIRRRVRR